MQNGRGFTLHSRQFPLRPYAFDEKLLKRGWKPDSTGKKKSHHKAPSSGTPAKPKAPAAPAAGPVSAPSKTKRKA